MLKFDQCQYVVEPSFFIRAADEKLEKGLSEEPIPIVAYYSASTYAEVPSLLHFDATSFPEPSSAGASGPSTASPPASDGTGRIRVNGILRSLNSVERFKTVDRQEFLEEGCAALRARAARGAGAAPDPASPLTFVLLLHCDLKTYKFYHWLCIPTLTPVEPFALDQPPAPLAEAFAASDAVALCDLSDRYRRAGGLAAWHVEKEKASAADGGYRCAPYRPGGGGAAESDTLMLAVSDPSNLSDNPGWPLRNILFQWLQSGGGADGGVPGVVKVVCIRESRGRADPYRSMVLSVKRPAPLEEGKPVGWLSNDAGRVGPRLTDLGPTFSPEALAEQASELNLRLMRWREAPELRLEMIGSQKCLILGSGTLGCQVARTLLGWGVRHLTMVDSGKVTYSNPVRQSLFTFKDCLGGGRPKAECAAERLREIFPGCRATGVQLSIPMPGHLAPGAEQMAASYKEAAESLDNLISSHDAVFLLTDTRESRWLPALLGAARGKLVLTSALGFDSFLVMRHGSSPIPPAPVSTPTSPTRLLHSHPSTSSSSSTPAAAAGPGAIGTAPRRLGCYFCNDVVAPRDSTKDRTMDQQCTVTRPGLSPIAGSLAVELMVATLQHHPPGSSAPPPPPPPGSRFASEPPHMLRGTLGGFSITPMEGRAYPQCTACGEAVVRAYLDGGWHGFLRTALEDPGYLEELTGLAALHKAVAEFELTEAENEAEEAAAKAALAGLGEDGRETSAGVQVGLGAFLVGAGATVAEDDEDGEWLAL